MKLKLFLIPDHSLQSSDPNDLRVLTPAHFLIGDSLSTIPEQDFSDSPSNRLSTYQHIQKIKQDFWSRWSKEYINELNVRKKWYSNQPSIQLGAIVLIRDDNLPPIKWKLGRVIELIPGNDGVTRIIKLKTASGEATRAVKKVALLPVETHNNIPSEENKIVDR